MSISKAYRYTTETGGSGPDTVQAAAYDDYKSQAEALEQKSWIQFETDVLRIPAASVGSLRAEWFNFALRFYKPVQGLQGTSDLSLIPPAECSPTHAAPQLKNPLMVWWCTALHFLRFISTGWPILLFEKLGIV